MKKLLTTAIVLMALLAQAEVMINSHMANVTGVMIGETGYGTAMIKKPACTFLVTIR